MGESPTPLGDVAKLGTSAGIGVFRSDGDTALDESSARAKCQRLLAGDVSCNASIGSEDTQNHTTAGSPLSIVYGFARQAALLLHLELENQLLVAPWLTLLFYTLSPVSLVMPTGCCVDLNRVISPVDVGKWSKNSDFHANLLLRRHKSFGLLVKIHSE